MIAEIEQAIIDLLQERWALVSAAATIAEFDIARDFEDILATPAISVVTEQIPMDTVVDGVVKFKPRVSVYQAFKNVGSGKGRRKGVYPIVEGTVQLLTGEDLGLGIDPLKPTGSAEVFHQTLKEKGLVCFKTLFETDFDLDVIPDEIESVSLLSEAISYYLGTENATTPDATDNLTFEG